MPVYGLWFHWSGYNRGMHSLDRTAVHTLETVATIIVPGFADLDQGARLEFQDILDQALALADRVSERIRSEAPDLLAP